MSCRPAGGHAGRAGQLQHHGEGAEAVLQQAAGRARPVGESESRRRHLSRSSGTGVRNAAVAASAAAVPQLGALNTYTG